MEKERTDEIRVKERQENGDTKWESGIARGRGKREREKDRE